MFLLSLGMCVHQASVHGCILRPISSSWFIFKDAICNKWNHADLTSGYIQ